MYCGIAVGQATANQQLVMPDGLVVEWGDGHPGRSVTGRQYKIIILGRDLRLRGRLNQTVVRCGTTGSCSARIGRRRH
jgi:hypothetical protein